LFDHASSEEDSNAPPARTQDAEAAVSEAAAPLPATAAASDDPSSSNGEVSAGAGASTPVDRKRLAEQLDALKRKEFELRRALAAALATSTAEDGSANRALAATVAVHDGDLAQLGISGARHAPRLSESSDRDRHRLDIELAALGPPAALGLVLNAPVLLGAALATTRAKHESWKATTMGVAGTALCPLVWTLDYVYLARRLGRGRALTITAAGAAGGIAALAWRDRFLRRRALTWLDRAARDQPTELAAARASRTRLREHVAALTDNG